MLSEEQIKSAKNGSDIVEVIGSRVKLEKSGTEFKGLCPFHDENTPSFSVNPAKQVYHCFGCGASGDVISFLQQYDGMDFKKTLSTLKVGEMGSPKECERERGVKPDMDIYRDYKPAKAPSRITGNLDIINPKREGKVWRDATPLAIYQYDDSDYVVRLEINGKKLTPMIRYANCPDGSQGWTMMPFDAPRKLYNYNQLDNQVLLVEGEKCVDAIQPIFGPNVSVMTWAGGTQSVDKTNWQSLAGRRITLWPDHDEPGMLAMGKIYQHLKPIAAEIKILIPPSDKPKGWDCADHPWLDIKQLASFCREHSMPAANYFDFKDPAPVAEFIPVDETPDIDAPNGITETIRRPDSFIEWPDQTSKGAPRGTLRNYKVLIDQFGYHVRYNAVSKDIEINIPGESFTMDNARACSMAHLLSAANEVGMPTGNIIDYTVATADKQTYSPVANWIESKPWDGQNRFPSLVKTLKPFNEPLSAMLLWRWMIGAIAAVYEPGGVSGAGVLVLQGPQGVGKTSWFWRLLGENRHFGKEGAILNPNDKDSVKQAISYWLVELGELDATFRKADIAALKSFLTRDSDEIRLPYARTESKFPRRTVFFASVNPKQFLYDETGNRRFWTIECRQKIDYQHSIDVQQLWAQIKTAYDSGAQWWLTQEEFDKLTTNNEEFESVSSVHEIIFSRYDKNAPIKTTKTASDVLLEIGYKNPSRMHQREAGQALRKLFGEPRRSMGRTVWDIPEPLY